MLHREEVKSGVWDGKYPQKELFFLWFALINRVLLDASLQVRKIQLWCRGARYVRMKVNRCSIAFIFGVLQGPGVLLNLLDEWFEIHNCKGDSMVHIFLAWAYNLVRSS